MSESRTFPRVTPPWEEKYSSAFAFSPTHVYWLASGAVMRAPK